MASELKVNKLTGVTTAGSISVTGEGTATTNLQQGLAKGFLAYKGKSTNAVYDSNNVSTVTDNGTGDHTANFTNNYNGANDYAVAGFGQEDTGGGGRTVAGIGNFGHWPFLPFVASRNFDRASKFCSR